MQWYFESGRRDMAAKYNQQVAKHHFHLTNEYLIIIYLFIFFFFGGGGTF